MLRQKLYLASSSPRRKELLASLGVSFKVVEPRFVERPTKFAADKEALYFAEQKARSVEKLCPNALVIASDTLICCEKIKMGKPHHSQEAMRVVKNGGDSRAVGARGPFFGETHPERLAGPPFFTTPAIEMLTNLSGKTHELYTAVVLLDTQNGLLKRHVEKVLVTFRVLSVKEIEDYAATGEPLGKAGAYAIQGAGKSLVSNVEGDIQAVIGLPLGVLKEWLGMNG